ALFAETSAVTPSLLALPPSHRAEPDREPPVLREEPRRFGRERLLEVLEQTNWNLSRAAARLGVPRNTLRYQLEKLGLLAKSSPVVRESSMPTSPPEDSPGIVTTWVPRRLALLRAELSLPPPDEPLTPGTWMDIVADKGPVCGGRVEERHPTGLVAALGCEPVEDAASRAAHTALALQKATERARGDGQAVGMALAVDVRRVQVGFASGTATIDMGAKREAWTSLDALLRHASIDTVVVSEAALPLRERRFEVAPLDVPGGVYRIVGHHPPGQWSGRRVSTFVGRHNDLDLLQRHLTEAMRGQGQVVSIVGDA